MGSTARGRRYHPHGWAPTLPGRAILCVVRAPSQSVARGTERDVDSGPEVRAVVASVHEASAERGARTGLDAPTLVLNRSFQPVRITTAKHAFTLLYLGRARALDGSFEPMDFEQWASVRPGPDEDAIGTTRGPIRVPRVLVLSGYNRVPSAPLRLSRRNVFLRDGFTCQYCGGRPPVRDLNLDHVMPRSRGGRSTWDNLVTSCRTCNVKKGFATPEECGMIPRARPHRPNWSMALRMAAPSTRYAEWEPFLEGLPDGGRDGHG